MDIVRKDTGLKKDIYSEIGELKRKSIQLRDVARSGEVNFDKSEEIRKQQQNIYDKLTFYNNFVKAVSKQGGL